MMQKYHPREDSSASQQHIHRIMNILQNKQATIQEIETQTGLSNQSITESIETLKSIGCITQSQKNGIEPAYMIPDNHPFLQPKSSLTKTIREMIPVLATAGGFTLLLKLGAPHLFHTHFINQEQIVSEVPPYDAAFQGPIGGMADTSTDLITESTSPLFLSDVAVWFFLGALFTVIIYILFEYIRKRRSH